MSQETPRGAGVEAPCEEGAKQAGTFPSTGDLLAELRGQGSGERIPLEEVVSVVGGRAHGLLVVLLALPEVVPMVGLSLILAFPIFLVGISMLRHGTDPPLPRWIRRRSISRARLEGAVDRTAGLVRRLDRVARPRWPRAAAAGRLQGGALASMAVLLAVPIPGLNVLAALAAMAIGLGILQRDGLVITAGIAAACLALAGVVGVVTGGIELVENWSGS